MNKIFAVLLISVLLVFGEGEGTGIRRIRNHGLISSEAFGGHFLQGHQEQSALLSPSQGFGGHIGSSEGSTQHLSSANVEEIMAHNMAVFNKFSKGKSVHHEEAHKDSHKPVVIPVPIKIPQPYLVKVPVPVTVEKIVEVPVVKEVPYPVEKPVPVKVVKKVPVPVHKPYPVPVYSHKG